MCSALKRETGFTLNVDKYNWEEQPHFIMQDVQGAIDFGEGQKGVYALPDTAVIVQRDREVQLAANACGRGRGVYISGLPYSFENTRLLYRAILWAAHREEELRRWFSANVNVEVHAYGEPGGGPEVRRYCVVNNTYEPQDTTVYRGDGSAFGLRLDANEIRWFDV